MREKPCNKCHETKALTEFYKRQAGAGGREAHCMDCRRAAAKINGRQRTLDKQDRKIYIPGGSNKWEIRHSFFDQYGAPLWDIGRWLTEIDVANTLAQGFFDDGMRLYNLRRNAECEVTTIGDDQVLMNPKRTAYFRADQREEGYRLKSVFLSKMQQRIYDKDKQLS